MTQSNASEAPFALVVDDDPLILMETTCILEDAGFRVLEAMNAAQAMRVLAQHHEKVVLMFTDVQMPGDENGFALARHTAEHWPHVAIVVASGERCPAAGDLPEGATFIEKPFSARIARQFVREVMPVDRQPMPLKSLRP
ncbi:MULTISPECIES: response regulator [unclassified Methylobacterium]|uniref:response regulator n=1 Tax=unclassified Methylobacterium TaxID=2615210 RepID=UPI001FEF3D91|nr:MULTISPECIES: response regulator [unclassified Methylobacterium]